MRNETTFTATLACPSCGLQGRHHVVAREACDPDDAEGGAWDVRVHACAACWQRRAQGIGLARERLRASGDLGETSRHRPTWQGAIVQERGHDPITGAVLSELLRQGVRPVEAARMRLSAANLGLVAKMPVS